ncbi:MAG TPA: Co2+/Mg2+ efflux protein ApaG [Bacteroidota bacterium]|nr:Co2+/Mg2+ efflux protein ApaG [Bacteroidota bacterium]
MKQPLHSEAVTHGIRVRAEARYLAEHSDPQSHRYVFGYHITITNEGTEPARLLSRHWIIIDADGKQEDVKGPGVVGKTPRLEPGESFEYDSFCPLQTEWGTMEGTYQMQRDNGDMFDCVIGRFFLVATSLMPSFSIH